MICSPEFLLFQPFRAVNPLTTLVWWDIDLIYYLETHETQIPCFGPSDFGKDSQAQVSFPDHNFPQAYDIFGACDPCSTN